MTVYKIGFQLRILLHFNSTLDFLKVKQIQEKPVYLKLKMHFAFCGSIYRKIKD